MKHKILEHLLENKKLGKKSLAVLVDPDKSNRLDDLINVCEKSPPDIFLLGSSFRGDELIFQCVEKLRSISQVPIVLFPGNMNQVVPNADALLLLSVISSRNPELLIGKQVEAALRIRDSKLEVIPTGYLLIESGRLTTVQYMSQSLPIPRAKPELAAATALAGIQQGLDAIYLEAGSGADETVPELMISAVSKNTGCLLFTGGGIVSSEQLDIVYRAGSDIAVVGNILESFPEMLHELIKVRDRYI